MKRGLKPSCLIAILTFACTAFAMEKENSTRALFEKLAKDIPYISDETYLYDRPEEQAFPVTQPKGSNSEKKTDPTIVHKRYLNGIKEVTNGTYPKQDLLDLLKQDEPKVRTLAAIALFDLEDPSFLPAINKLRNDKTPSFEDYNIGPTWYAYMEQRSVGAYADRMIDFYMNHSGWNDSRKFNEYWQVHKDLSSCAGWLSVKLDRASNGTRPTQPECQARIQAVRKQINTLPPDERAWTLLFLGGEAGSDLLIEGVINRDRTMDYVNTLYKNPQQKEMVSLLKKIAPEKLMLMLQRRLHFTDPDLNVAAQATNCFQYTLMQIFVLQHAEQLLRTSDCNALLEYCDWENDNARHVTPWWFIAAAHLQPQRAEEILNIAIPRYSEEYHGWKRALLYKEMWNLIGSPATPTITEWFFDPKTNSDHSCNPTFCGMFLRLVGQENNGLQILRHLAIDSRMEQIDGYTFRILLEALNCVSEQPVATEQEIRGIGNSDTNLTLLHQRLVKQLSHPPKDTAKTHPKADPAD